VRRTTEAAHESFDLETTKDFERPALILRHLTGGGFGTVGEGAAKARAMLRLEYRCDSL